MRAATAASYHLGRHVLGAASRVYFRRIEVRNGDRIPRRGPLLVVANHPASFTDVVVLGASVPRQLHFLAMAPIFKPWIRGVALRLAGTLPVYRKVDDPSQMHRNDDTFRAVHEILGIGGAVLIFPEGTSLTDRRIVKVKTGAARIALGHSGSQALTVLPIGLHFEERSDFRSEVTVSVGHPIELAPYRAVAESDAAEAVRRLTDHIQLALEQLILHLGEDDRRELVEAIEELFAEEARETMPETHPLDISRRMAECVEYYARTDPARLVRGWKRIQSYRRKLTALGLDDRAVKELGAAPGSRWTTLHLVAVGLLGAIPAAIGTLVHYVPYRLSGGLGSLMTSDATQLAAVRMGLGVVLFPATYAGLAALFLRVLGWSAPKTILVLALLVPLGLFALPYYRWMTHQRQRLRLLLLRIGHRRRVAALRGERRRLMRLFQEAREEWHATQGEAVAS